MSSSNLPAEVVLILQNETGSEVIIKNFIKKFIPEIYWG
jgi:hypothetical protein